MSQRNAKNREKALTLIEALSVLVIIASLSVILTPVVAKAKRAAQVGASTSKLQQLFAALTIYRSEHDGSDVFYGPKAYYASGLPTFEYWNSTAFDLPNAAWESPCGDDPTIRNWAPIPNAPGWLIYAAPSYDPWGFEGGGNPFYRTYFQDYRQNSVLFVEPYCNPPGTDFSNPYVKKFALAVLFSGRLVRRADYGNAFYLQWYSEREE